MSDNIPLFEIAWDGDDVKNVVDSVTRGGYWANGPYIDRFEEHLESYFDTAHAVVFNSGTTALVSALKAYGVGPGDEVIVPSFTFISTANAAKIVGAEPVFAEVEHEHYGLDPADVRERITEDTAAVIPVHYAGKACRITELQTIADEHGLTLIEDAAEALGATLDGQKVCTFGDAGMLSFCQNKVVTTGEGGAIVTDDEDIAAELRLLRSHGRATGEYFESTAGGDYVTLGNNFRMADVNAAIGTAQMEKVESLIADRRTVANRLTDRLDSIEKVAPLTDPPNGRHVYQLYTVEFDSSVDRDQVASVLADRGISSKVYFDPVHLTEFYRQEHGYEPGTLPETEALSSRVLSLPMHTGITPAETERIAEGVAAAIDAAD